MTPSAANNLPMPPEPAQALDPDFLGDPHYSKWCGRGSIVIVHPKTFELTITPLRCGSWTCDYCGPKKADELRHRIAGAQANRFITLTCAHPGNSTPAQAEYAMREGWTKFIARLRKTCPELEYFRVIEYQQNGWPHFHVLLRCEYLPKKIIQDAWHKYCWPGFVSIQRIRRKRGMPFEIVKYIIKAYKIAGYLAKHQRLFSASREFFPARSAGDEQELDPDRYWFITSLTPDDISFRLTNALFAIETTLNDGRGYQIKARARDPDAWLKAVLMDLERLPWYNNHNNNLPHAPPALRLPVLSSGPAQQELLMPYPEQVTPSTP